MEPPIASGTILQNRYHLLRVLDQGEFNRTYLVEDQGRFNEPCALKEFIPPQTETNNLDKSRQLFQQEAGILYKIEHPQIPQFRATFEEEGRLFLVRDYVEGKTYGDLLEQRKALHNQSEPLSYEPDGEVQSPPMASPTKLGVLSETEVRQLLQQSLPVLDYIHSQGIIHRDITPDNIIMRETDSIPVFINLGVVQELATRLQLPDTPTPTTSIGKSGYAPREQIQTGQVYPSSDLYSLAVTAIVLLTGKEPEELVDDTNLTWNWRPWARVSDELAEILNQMLSSQPSDRYQSGREVLYAFQASGLTPQLPKPKHLRGTTVASAQARTPRGARGGEPSEPVMSQARGNSIWNSPWPLLGIATGLAVLAGIGSWVWVGNVNQQDTGKSPSPKVSVSPSPSPSPSASPSASPTPSKPQIYSQRLGLSAGKTLSKSSNLKANHTINYIIQGKQDQTLKAYLSDEGVLMTVLGPDGKPVDNRAQRVRQWQGKFLFTGNYTIQLSPVKGLPDSNYQLGLRLTEAPKQKPEPKPTAEYKIERVNLLQGTKRLQLLGSTSPQKIQRYLVKAKQGQQLKLEVIESDVALSIRYPNGKLVEKASGVQRWQGKLPSSGEYIVDVIAKQERNFAVDISLTD
ncbi:serine/threonine protein kinase [Moorena producens PAL-8-15-08-1]|uniref:non-specific serine/threonine protein kinase n=1 Tax=Moorena producens PAL-8-15-08-1 TaxID=1458985 RepID=A0A1D8U161_9CYAN|nr:serine/threonine-protein kinase [Moorena producens]AOX03534.1 serine/threonine protein kinase [Moorena producens PAL-8-15-08-1]